MEGICAFVATTLTRRSGGLLLLFDLETFRDLKILFQWVSFSLLKGTNETILMAKNSRSPGLKS